MLWVAWRKRKVSEREEDACIAGAIDGKFFLCILVSRTFEKKKEKKKCHILQKWNRMWFGLESKIISSTEKKHLRSNLKIHQASIKRAGHTCDNAALRRVRVFRRLEDSGFPRRWFTFTLLVLGDVGIVNGWEVFVSSRAVGWHRRVRLLSELFRQQKHLSFSSFSDQISGVQFEIMPIVRFQGHCTTFRSFERFVVFRWIEEFLSMTFEWLHLLSMITLNM